MPTVDVRSFVRGKGRGSEGKTVPLKARKVYGGIEYTPPVIINTLTL